MGTHHTLLHVVTNRYRYKIFYFGHMGAYAPAESVCVLYGGSQQMSIENFSLKQFVINTCGFVAKVSHNRKK